MNGAAMASDGFNSPASNDHESLESSKVDVLCFMLRRRDALLPQLLDLGRQAIPRSPLQLSPRRRVLPFR